MPQIGEARPARTGRTSTPKQQCQPRATMTKPKAYAHLTPETPLYPAPGTSTRESRRTYYLQDALLIVALLAVCTTLYVTAGWMNDHAPQIIAGLIVVACISLLGVIVAAFIAGPKS